MHLAVYRARPDVGGVVHTHSPYATTFAVLNKEIPPVLLECAHFGGSLRVAPIATPGTAQLAETVVSTLGQDSAILLQSHGVLAAASSIEEALVCAVYVEDVARVYYLASVIGRPEPVPAALLEVLLERHRRRAASMA